MTSQINLVDESLLPKPALIDGRAAAAIVGVALLGVAIHGGMESAQLRSALDNLCEQLGMSPLRQQEDTGAADN